MSLLKKIWGDPVWSKVIATGIVAVVAVVATYLAGWWPTFAAFAKKVASFGAATTTVPNWLLILLSLCAVALLFFLGIALWTIIAPGSSEPLPRASYREDDFFGIRWRWSYNTDGDIVRLMSFCPGCDYQIYPRDVSGYQEPEHLKYNCDDCGARINEFKMPEEEIESRVIRQIHKKIRSGSWRTKSS